MATFNIFGYTFEHLASATLLPNNSYLVQTETGYYIHKPTFGELEYKTATILYFDDDLANVIIVAAADLSEDAVINGVTTPPEIMSTEETETE